VLSLSAVAKRYDRRGPWVVRDVSVDVPPGAVIRVDGRNGSGKSTLLRVLAGVTKPSRGTVEGRVATAYVPERFSPALPFTVRAYLTHLGRVQGVAGAGSGAVIDEWSDRFGLTPFAAWPIESLSKGTAQKVALVQGFMARPDVLVLDEAATGLDRAARAALRDAVDERRAGGVTTVFVDHDPAAMAGLVTHRWLVEGTRVESRADGAAGAVTAGAALPADAALAAHTPGAVAGSTAVMVVEIAGPGAGALLSAPLAGVHGARLLDDGAVELRVETGCSDDVLRAVLALPLDLHVRRLGDDRR
jgi:ABC-type Mn2+/Zn2+ transport system ATPase subunit